MYIDSNGIEWEFRPYSEMYYPEMRRNRDGSYYLIDMFNRTFITTLWEQKVNESSQYRYIMYCMADYSFCYNLTERIYTEARSFMANKLYPESYKLKRIDLAIFSPVVVLGVIGEQHFLLLFQI